MNHFTQSDNSDGYLSDVPTHHSNAVSEASQDLIASTKVLENHFRDKYQVLRSAYEYRIKKLSEAIQNICGDILSDELIKQLKNDPSTLLYVPSHISEIIERFLVSDRENYVHELIQKLSTVEVELSSLKKVNHTMREDIEKASHYRNAQELQFQNQIDLLKRNIVSISEENEKLKYYSHKKVQEINILEKSFEKNSRELAIIEGIDQEEQRIKKELRSSLQELSKSNSILNQENSLLKQDLLLKSQELEQVRVKLQEASQQDSERNLHIQQLIQKFEVILEQENKENEISFVSIQEKMKHFRNKLLRELKLEKSVNKELQIEIQTLQQTKSENQHELHILKGQVQLLQSQLKKQESDKEILSQKLEEISRENRQLELSKQELEVLAKQLENKIIQSEKIFLRENESLRDKITIELQKEFKSEQDELDRRAEIHRLSQENQMHRLANDLKHSYSPTVHDSTVRVPNNLQSYQQPLVVDQSTMVNEIADEVALYQIIQRLTKEKQQIVESHQNEIQLSQDRKSVV